MMNPLPVEPGVAAASLKLQSRISIGLRFALFFKTAGVVELEPQIGKPFTVGASSEGIGSTHAMSHQVSRALFPSRVLAAGTPANEDVSRIPHDARTFVLKGTTR